MIANIMSKWADGIALTPDEKNELFSWFSHAETTPDTMGGYGVIQQLDQITHDLGDMYAGRFIAPSSTASSIEPTETGFTGSFMSGDPLTFGSTGYNVGGVAAGVFQAGFNTSGKWIAGAGSITGDVSGLTMLAKTYPSSAYLIWKSDDDSTIVSQLVGTYSGALSNSGLLAIGKAHDSGVHGLIYLNALGYSAALTDEGVNLVLQSNGRVDLDLHTGTLTGINQKYFAIQSESSGTNATDIILHLEASTSGTVANGFGVGITYGLEDSGGSIETAGYEEIIWTDKTNASEDAAYNIYLMKAGTLTKSITVDPTAGVSVPFGLSVEGAVTINDLGADKDMRIEGDTDANLFFLDASTDRVGVGTNSPSSKLEVAGNTTISSGGLDVTNGHVRSFSQAISDDAAVSFTPTKTAGSIQITTGGTGNGGLGSYNTATPTMGLVVGGANLAVTTGTLSGTTGTDGKLTISAHTDGKIYIENRTGSQRTVFVLLV